MAGEAKGEKKEKGFWTHMFTWVVAVFGILVIYVLSVGPVVKYVGPTHAIEVFYAPVTLVCDQSTLADKFLTGYLKIWHIDAGSF